MSKKPEAIVLASMGGIVSWYFLELLTWAFPGHWGWMMVEGEFWDFALEIFIQLWKVSSCPWKYKIDLLRTNSSKALIYLSLQFFLVILVTKKSQINQSFGTVCLTEVCPTFSRVSKCQLFRVGYKILSVKSQKFNLERTSFDLNAF